MANQNSTKYEKCIGLRLTSSSKKDITKMRVNINEQTN